MTSSIEGHVAGAEKLHQYWVHGEGAAKIRWGTPGDFDRCTRQLEEHAHFTPEQAHGYCNLAHHAATGMYPATHAALEHGHRSAAMADQGNITTPNAADLDTAARRYCASQGWAMPDGSYPIRPVNMHGRSDLEKAIHAVGRGSGSHGEIRAHIKRRASALGMSDQIPDDWGSSGDSGREMSTRNIEWRSAAVDDVNRKQRIITLIAVPYEEEGEAFYRGEMWKEVHHRGAYRGLDLSAGRVPLNVEHDPKIQLGKAASIDPEHPAGLLSRMKISDRGEMGERYLDLAADDAVAASIGFYLKSNMDQRLNRRTMLREINRAFLDHIALVGQPAYSGAKVLSVASDEQTKTTADLPRLQTPNLDAVLNDEIFQWAASQRG